MKSDKLYGIFSRNIQHSCLIDCCLFSFVTINPENRIRKAYIISSNGLRPPATCIQHKHSFFFSFFHSLSLLIHMLFHCLVLLYYTTGYVAAKKLTLLAMSSVKVMLAYDGWDGDGTKLKRKACESGCGCVMLTESFNRRTSRKSRARDFPSSWPLRPTIGTVSRFATFYRTWGCRERRPFYW